MQEIKLQKLQNNTNPPSLFELRRGKGSKEMKEQERREFVEIISEDIRSISAEVLSTHIQREDVVKATWLSLISGKPAFLLGVPGVDKTGTVQGMAARISGAVFYDALMPTIVSPEQLLVEATEIIESQNGVGKVISTRDTLGRAASAHIVFADEIWKAEPRILQTLIDLSKGDGVRHEGQMVKTPLLSFLCASNELPDSEGNLGAIWSRMTIRSVINPLDKAGKAALVKARLIRDREAKKSGAKSTIKISDLETLRDIRPHVGVPEDLINIALEIYESLLTDDQAGFQWAWDDDRRFGRIFDVMQANAILDGRIAVNKSDLSVLELLLWDRREQIASIKAKIAPYCRTALIDAQELLDALLSPTGLVAIVLNGDRSKGVQALTQCEETERELDRLKTDASGDQQMVERISALITQLEQARQGVTAVVLGTKKK